MSSHRPAIRDRGAFKLLGPALADPSAAIDGDLPGGRNRPVLVPTRYASGFMLPTAEALLGGPSSFGHPGRGGSLGLADPQSGVAFGYVVSHIRQNRKRKREVAKLIDGIGSQ
jgi:CubicO group peptidase (beta-lactamase class C family)